MTERWAQLVTSDARSTISRSTFCVTSRAMIARRVRASRSSARRARVYARLPMVAAVATTSTTAKSMRRAASESKWRARRISCRAVLVAAGALLTVVTAAVAWGTDVDTPGSAFVERDTGFVVPHFPLWLGGDLTVTGVVPENGAASIELDDINLLARFEPHPRLSIFSETRLENTFSFTEGHGADLDTADVFIERLYLDWLAGPHLTVRVGKFLTPFGIWNQIRRAPLTWTVERPLVTEHTFPEHTTGVGLMYQATLRGWSIDGTVYAPAQDELPLRESDESGLTLLGGRVAASHEIGTAYL